MNRWKIAFWTLLMLTFVIVGVGCYLILDQSVSLTYMQDGYKDTEEDLRIYTQLIEEKKPHYHLIKRQLERQSVDFVEKDEEGIIIGLHRTTMRFDTDSVLTKIEINW